MNFVFSYEIFILHPRFASSKTRSNENQLPYDIQGAKLITTEGIKAALLINSGTSVKGNLQQRLGNIHNIYVRVTKAPEANSSLNSRILGVKSQPMH